MTQAHASHRNRPTRRGRLLVGTVALVTCLLSSACAAATPTPPAESTEQLNLYATTGYLADAIRTIAPDATVTTMVGPGGDPHTYQPATKDINALMQADVVFWNGLHLEAQMLDQLSSLGENQLAVGEQLPTELLIALPETDDAGAPMFDPHIWNSPSAWSQAVALIAEKLGTIDPEHATEYHARASDYSAEINAAASEAHALLAAIPEPRILITGHDAFAYLGETFDLDVRATDFVSSQAQLSPRELSDLAALVATNKVPVIFHDNQANPQAISSLTEAVHNRGWNVKVSDAELFADSLGAEPGVDTYLGVFQHNTRTIAEALGGIAK